jgi:hypothetical protein
VRREELGPEGQQLWDSIVNGRGGLVVTADGGLAVQRVRSPRRIPLTPLPSVRTRWEIGPDYRLPPGDFPLRPISAGTLRQPHAEYSTIWLARRSSPPLWTAGDSSVITG